MYLLSVLDGKTIHSPLAVTLGKASDNGAAAIGSIPADSQRIILSTHAQNNNATSVLIEYDDLPRTNGYVNQV